MTRSGWRSKITVRPPSGICATTEAATPAALHRIQPGRAATRRAAIAAIVVHTMAPRATTRFPNSTSA